LDKVLAARLVPVFARSAKGGFVEPQINVDPPAHPEFYGRGHALYSTAADYMRFLRMWLGKGQLDGVQILKPDSATQYLENHIGELRVLPLRTALPAAVEDLILFPSCPKTHSLGFARTEKDMEGMRAAGSQFWGGVLNTHFWFDPTNDVAGILMTQLLPFLDDEVMFRYADFERAVYANLDQLKDAIRP
jgi:methyl acetate hydrolase